MGKYETKTYPSPSGGLKAHFYKNKRTGTIHYDDYKVKSMEATGEGHVHEPPAESRW